MALLFGVIVGLALGLTGSGGSIFAVPLLVYGLGLAPHDAVGVSLVAVALTAAVGAAGAVRAGLVEYRAGFIFAAAGMLAAPLGVRWVHWLSESAILIAFAALMIVVAFVMWRRAQRHPGTAAVVRAGAYRVATEASVGPFCRNAPGEPLQITARCSAALAVAGAATGVLSGLLGVGGGFLIVPALTLIAKVDMHRAVATSLLLITLIGFSGVVAIVLEGRTLPWGLTALLVAGGVVGMMAGRLFARRVAGAQLQKVFAGMMILIAAFMLVSRRL